MPRSTSPGRLVEKKWNCRDLTDSLAGPVSGNGNRARLIGASQITHFLCMQQHFVDPRGSLAEIEGIHLWAKNCRRFGMTTCNPSLDRFSFWTGRKMVMCMFHDPAEFESQQRVSCSISDSLHDWMSRCGGAVAITTYQAGKLYAA